MKLEINLFLFFILNIFILFSIQNIYSQEKTDSLLYYRQILISPSNPTDLSSAYIYFDKYYKQNLSKGNTLEAIQGLRYIASIENKLGSPYESEATIVEALKLTKRLNNKNEAIGARIGIYNHLGIIYRNLNDYEKALEYYDKVLELAQTQEQKNKVFLNKGNIYKDQKKYELALNAFNKVYDNISNSNNQLFIANSLDNVGYVQSKLNIPEALPNLMKALEIKLEKNDIKSIYKSYSNLREYYKDRNNNEKAFEYANKAYDIAKQINSSSFIFDALSNLIEFNVDEKVVEYRHLNDSIEDFKKRSKNRNAAKKYSLDVVKEEVSKKEIELEQQKLSKYIFILLSILIFSISIFLYFILKNKHKKDKIKEVYLKEVELSKKVHDELANDMSDLMNYVENDIETSNDKKTLLLDNLEDIYVRTRDISTETASIDLTNFTESLSNLLLQHNKAGTKVVINDINTINWNKVSDHKKMIIYRCLQELMVNMKKHSQAKLVSIFFKEQNNKKEIRYVDDGIGFSVEGTKLNGLENVESRIKSIQGTFTFITSKENGFKAILKFNS